MAVVVRRRGVCHPMSDCARILSLPSFLLLIALRPRETHGVGDVIHPSYLSFSQAVRHRHTRPWVRFVSSQVCLLPVTHPRNPMQKAKGKAKAKTRVRVCSAVYITGACLRRRCCGPRHVKYVPTYIAAGWWMTECRASRSRRG